VAAAKKAFSRGSAWRTLDASGRGRLLNKLADALERDGPVLAALESLDNGKPYAVALAADVGLAVKCFRYYAGWADKIFGRTVSCHANHPCAPKTPPRKKQTRTRTLHPLNPTKTDSN
jgi:acyl-CoA reductase-like NAD-dependent aldehyde dehydrogenase